MEQLSENIIVEKAKNGDEVSLDFLMQKYKKMANKIARSYFLVGAEYDDLLQEAMIGLYNAIIKYDEKSGASFQTFAYKCITRNVQTAVKTANRKKHQALNSSVSLSNQSLDTSSAMDNDDINLYVFGVTKSPDEKLIEIESYSEIKESIKKALSTFELSVLIHYLSGESYFEIAQKLNKDNKSIDNALSRIRNKLSFLKR